VTKNNDEKKVSPTTQREKKHYKLFNNKNLRH